MNNPFISTVKSQFADSYNFQQTLDRVSAGESVVWDGCYGSSYALLGATLVERAKKTLLVLVAKVAQVERVANDFALFTDATVLKFPLLSSPSQIDADEIFVSEDVEFGARLQVLKALDKLASDVKTPVESKPLIVVASLEAILQPVPSKKQTLESSVELRVGEEFDRDELIRWLSDKRFHSTPAVELPGEYSVRGHIVDVYAVDWKNPVRIEFFGDEVESIRVFDVTDQRSVEDKTSLEITKLQSRGVAEGRFIDRLPNNLAVLMIETTELIGETTRIVENKTRMNGANERSASVAETVNALYRYPTVHSTMIASGSEFASLAIRADFHSVEKLQGGLPDVESALNALEADESVGIVCSSDIDARRLDQTFVALKPSREKRLFFSVGVLNEGFSWRDKTCFLLIGSDQLFNRSISRRTSSPNPKKLRKAVDSFMELTPGDLVIHVDRGLARYLGVETIQKANQLEDHLKLEFADAAYLYVPASKIGKIQRYVGAGGRTPQLAKLNGTVWNKQKKEAQKAIWELAAEMLDVQAERETQEGIAFPPDGQWQGEFEALFPYRETDDQLLAIQAIKKDMEKPRPMDRLLCGDVGFGKTEVALRAAFKAVEAGYQAAVLVPTVVLAEQHYRTFRDRTSTFPVTVALLSRYSSNKEQKETLKKLKEGKVDIVVGTHRVVQKDVAFKNLGLVVIDEEQKFGVKVKESLKKYRSMVDVLTMTATPIPRTLHFSLIGLRDISNLQIPPADRLPVETKILRFNQEVVRNAILRELNRGGQVYYLHNRVKDIDDEAEKLKKLVPEARVRVGHAQMPTGELEEIMRDFVLGRFDVLVCTTIVESGLDIPNANTIFIDKADCFGLAELHQLRGRVGREKKQAYCYLLLDALQTLSSDAAKRLRALEEYDKLGSGFQIALKDLEIRGAGNILGTQQSGHIALIGYEMYCYFLDAAVRALKKQPQKIRVEVEVDLPGTVLLSDEYVPDSRAKIDFYRRFDRVSNIKEAVELRNELVDRFGKPPIEAERLFTLAQIRLAAFNYRVKSIQFAQIKSSLYFDKMLVITFRAPDLMYQLRSKLKERGVTMNFVDTKLGALKGYVELPRDLFDPDGKPFVDNLMKYALDVLSVGKGVDDADARSYVQTRNDEKNQGEKQGSNKPKSNALLEALKRIKSEKR